MAMVRLFSAKPRMFAKPWAGVPAHEWAGAGIRNVAPGKAATVLEPVRLQQPYPHFKVVVLDDDVNTYQHVVACLLTYIPGMQPDQAWALAKRIDTEGSAVVWCGPQEQAELYHQQLGAEGLTMAPLEPA
jgi:ATP-dependent Clp protease adaptor protein ClpS